MEPSRERDGVLRGDASATETRATLQWSRRANATEWPELVSSGVA